MQSGISLSSEWPESLALVAPVVAISACALMMLAFYSRLSSIVARLRSFQRERLAEQEHIHRISQLEPVDETMMRRRGCVLSNLAEQTRLTLRRAKLIRLTLVCLLGTIVLLIASSIFNALSVLAPRPWWGRRSSTCRRWSCCYWIGCAIAELLSVLDVVESEAVMVNELATEWVAAGSRMTVVATARSSDRVERRSVGPPLPPDSGKPPSGRVEKDRPIANRIAKVMNACPNRIACLT